MPTNVSSTDETLHVAVVCSVFPKLSETFVLDHVTGLLDRGHHVTVIARRAEGERLSHTAVRDYGLLDRMVPRPRLPATRTARLVRLGGRIMRTPYRDLQPTLRAIRLGGGRTGPLHALTELDLLRALPDVDVFHCHFGPVGAAVATAMVADRDPRPLVTTFHGSDVSRARHAASHERFTTLFERADCLLTVSQLWRRELLDFGAPRERTIVLHQGVDTNALGQVERGVGAPVKVLSVGRLVEKKGFDSAIEAVARLHANGMDVHHTVAGDGPEMARLGRLVAHHGLDDRIRLLGAVDRDRVRELLYESHVLLAPSQTSPSGDREGIPVVLMEAMATGLPVVSTRHSGIPELVEHGVTGLLADEGDSTTLAHHVERLVRDPGLRQTLADAGRHRVMADHDASTQLDRIVDIYRDLVAGTR